MRIMSDDLYILSYKYVRIIVRRFRLQSFIRLTEENIFVADFDQANFEGVGVQASKEEDVSRSQPNNEISI